MATDPAADANKSPLDVLEEILGQAQAKSTAANDPNALTPEQIAEQERKKAEAEALALQKQQEEKARLAAQIAELETIKTTPQYQARVEQEEAKKQKQEAQQQAQDGYEIMQLGHKKI